MPWQLVTAELHNVISVQKGADGKWQQEKNIGNTFINSS